MQAVAGRLCFVSRYGFSDRQSDRQSFIFVIPAHIEPAVVARRQKYPERQGLNLDFHSVSIAFYSDTEYY